MSNNQHKKKAAILPTWVLRLIGYSSLAAAIISFAIYWFKKYPPRRGITSNEVLEQMRYAKCCSNEHV